MDRFRLAKARIDRALLSLEAQEEWSRDRTVLSRLIIALNTLATECDAHARLRSPASSEFLNQMADMLWSIGEKAAKIDPSLNMAEDRRPK